MNCVYPATSVKKPPIPSSPQTDFDSSQHIGNDHPIPCASQIYEDSSASMCDNQPFFPNLINVEQSKPDTNKKRATKPFRFSKNKHPI
ncbi:20168_t:CDS:2 [Gigaspora rosea]|nr:20168_t:CDS:2 [Gigaspora rosea]